MIDSIKDKFHQHVLELQDKISEKLKDLDPKVNLQEDLWKRNDFKGGDGGGGRTRAFEGSIIENAGVNTSLVFGEIDPQFAKKLGSDATTLWATGLSLIIHPRNPRVPTTHANFRMIQSGEKVWFGGGADLTPYYPYVEDFVHFHKTWEKACEPYGRYPEMKKVCDEYFTNPHRDGEMRGIGGIFFDHLNTGDQNKDFDMVVDLSNHFIESYFPILDRRYKEEWTEEDEDFQLHRRGRYVEFNLLHDRGTAFGLKTNGRTDSILISLPGRCKFSYKYSPNEDGPHQKMMPFYRPMDWVGSQFTQSV